MKKETFEYNYSAVEQDEVKKIREKYMPKEENKMEQLRKLDAKATQKGTIISIVLGCIGTLVFGAGMSITLVWGMFLWGIVIGVFGALGVAMAYPLYVRITEKEREKIAPEIIKLTEELMK